MDGTKRKLSPVSPAYSPLYLGATPPWSLPPSIYAESAIRSTQNGADCVNVAPFPYIPVFGNELANVALPVKEEKSEDDDYETIVDTKNDGVYMINAGEGSWSGPLRSEYDPEEQSRLPYQAEIALAHLKRAQELVKQQETVAAGSAERQTRLQEVAWKKDLLLRNTIRRIKEQLQAGGVLVVEHLETGLALLCAHPHCPASDMQIPNGAYYLALTNDHAVITTYCLFCLEGLWSGNGMLGTLESTNIVQLDGAPQYQSPKPSPLVRADFSIPQSLLSSKHAPSAEELSALLLGANTTPGSPVSSEDSIASEGKWRCRPTPFQYLHSFVRSGSSLTAIETAVVELWKMASEEQLRWEEHRQNYKETGAETRAGPDGEERKANGVARDVKVVQQNRAGVRKDSVQDHEDDRQQEFERVSGLKQRQCQGKNLTAVLAEVCSGQTS